MSIGEYFIFAFVSVIFCLGLYFGFRLFKWNQNDMKRKTEENKNKSKKN